jgi:hypothetical protein
LSQSVYPAIGLENVISHFPLIENTIVINNIVIAVVKYAAYYHINGHMEDNL